jgi:mono/diheme cytochrome c family protein
MARPSQPWEFERRQGETAPHAARCAACHGVRSHPAPVALVGECPIPVV